MKKLFLSLIAMLASSLTANAFVDIDWGVTGGYNLSSLNIDKSEITNTLKGKSGTSGWYIGPKVNVGLFLGLSADAAAVYNQREFKVSTNNTDNQTKHSKTIDFPINLKYRLSLGGTGVYVSTGPQFSFNVGNKKWDIGELLVNTGMGGSIPTPVSGVFKSENMTTKWNVGAGVMLMDRLEIGISYNKALGKEGKTLLEGAGLPIGFGVSEYKADTYSLQATLYF
ncbi:PorT family protein [Alloprevotella sp. OH1205_COT-284]|uniref:outer membrane beta-barrel protein n=1 Tax=Alloprevotella sp. OH1205_COT-284 TaxID=2491043 RepID=UPI000F5FCF63|nr:outer membrane beta-barrel protein [Alloprevotella sp. OH1205_COT-284]RRD80831.1 PorT family protein [Alloprevotella sp. OH1205_COT-284]